jgi:UDP-N-acetylmuramate: L-alanyl-gamma-D-glutamyl-meso-diaminopimelate ligase
MLDGIIDSCDSNSTILVMSNGGFNGIHQKLLKKLNDK